MTTIISSNHQPAQFLKAIQYGAPALLALSSGLLTSLVPGGLIETRSFAHINPIVLGSFNTFLTSLSLLSLLLIYFVWQRQRWAYAASAITGLSYFLVYVLDLGRLFPVSPDAMSSALFVIEVLGTIVSLPLMIVSVQGLWLSRELSLPSPQVGNHSFTRVKQFTAALVIALLGLGIITFATRSAMGL
ncbi:hypothetical protein [Acaryochloris sp. CCMEE 5410]|uniref:hypothetical protein n=1 Tax=Acaryochloris sp. CCMEE 5410 TaxID=310037 RepID=UPI0002483D8F|nr:hypothetical protein [Acaryochloris sp. CCMEE 5410]KAI9134750.1 hypothetical protein ON05_016775 [Acaryochloris sp. CCMEE 5410]